ncbi:hypothetical protein DOY81_000560 [Sarcophaga bullata]|nr:hypothetical protein DOY81_000560 [Sarcophaga bullata]
MGLVWFQATGKLPSSSCSIKKKSIDLLISRNSALGAKIGSVRNQGLSNNTSEFSCIMVLTLQSKAGYLYNLFAASVTTGSRHNHSNANKYYSPAPSAVVGGNHMPAMEEAITNPRPIAKGPPIYKNLSLGAQTAIVDKPPTMPPV